MGGLALFLSSKASAFLTGATFVIDGGQSIGPSNLQKKKKRKIKKEKRKKGKHEKKEKRKKGKEEKRKRGKEEKRKKGKERKEIWQVKEKWKKQGKKRRRESYIPGQVPKGSVVEFASLIS